MIVFFLLCSLSLFSLSSRSTFERSNDLIIEISLNNLKKYEVKLLEEIYKKILTLAKKNKVSILSIDMDEYGEHYIIDNLMDRLQKLNNVSFFDVEYRPPNNKCPYLQHYFSKFCREQKEGRVITAIKTRRDLYEDEMALNKWKAFIGNNNPQFIFVLGTMHSKCVLSILKSMLEDRSLANVKMLTAYSVILGAIWDFCYWLPIEYNRWKKEDRLIFLDDDCFTLEEPLYTFCVEEEEEEGDLGDKSNVFPTLKISVPILQLTFKESVFLTSV